MYMLAEINLPNTTTRIKVRDIPALFATAIHFLPPEGSPRQLIGIKKIPLTDANKQAWCGIGPGENTPVFPVCLTEEDHQAAWGDLPTLNLPMDESEWLAYADSFVLALITDWGLVPEFEGSEAFRLIEWDEEVFKAVKSGELKPYDGISFLSIPKAIENELSEAFVHVENLKEFASKRKFLLKFSGDWYETRRTKGRTIGANRRGYINSLTWFVESQSKGRYSIEDAALLVERETGSSADNLVKILKQAALAGTLPIYKFGDDVPYVYGEGFAVKLRVESEECYWEDVNTLLDAKAPKLKFRFTEPKPMALSIPQSSDIQTIPPSEVDGEARERELASYFDPVGGSQLEKMFPSEGKWPSYIERASRNGLRDKAKVGRAKFNPYLAALWWLDHENPKDWDLAKCLRVLGNNLPIRSKNLKHEITGYID